MVENPHIQDVDTCEDKFINAFRSTLRRVIPSLDNAVFQHLLKQRRLLALEFTPAYERVLVGLEDEEAKRVVRELIREEYPSAKIPTHREDILYDLELCGLTKTEVLTAPPTPTTQKTITELRDITRYQHPKYYQLLDYDVRGLIALRTAFEVLVAEEYELLLHELKERFQITVQDSRFYAPHAEHDKKRSPLYEQPRKGMTTHSD